MAIPDEEVAQVRAATDIVGLISEHSALRQQGRRWTGLCPFHGERTPSFSVNAEEGLYYCFGCQASGDAISFVRAVEHMDFADAVRHLAERAGIVLHESAAGGEDHRRRTALLSAMEQAVAWYHESLLSSPAAGGARDYLRSRGYDGAIVRQFRLGWAPDDWDALSSALGLPERVLTGTGLGFVNRRGRLQDSFRSRIIFPICDPSGHPIALGGRILPAPKGAPQPSDRAPEPKYKNSQETAIYAKRRTLYALNWAKKDIVASGEIVVCEGYTDVIGCFQAGVPRAVATCGTALAEEHFTLLRNFARRIVLAYDADSAGQTATGRVYEWERKHEVDVFVAALPAGSDPGQLAQEDPDALRSALGAARPFLQFRVDRILAAASLDTAEGRARAADEAIQAIAEHPSDLVRDQYVMTVSDRCRLEPDLLRTRLDAARRSATTAGDGRRAHSGRARPAGGRIPNEEPAERDRVPVSEEGEAPPRRSPRGPDPAGRPGLEALRFAVHRPEAVADRLEAVLFVDELQRRAFETLLGADDLHQAIDDAPPDVAELLRRVAVEEPVVVEGGITDPVDALVTNLTRIAATRAVHDLDIAARAGEISAADAQVKRVKLWIEALDDPADGSEASSRLLAWLLARREG
ncbi:MAG TPA: DNA primase [Acidimicrobiales bacterium]|nr:DNA primase [Acidimicrobiales bacterium]